MKLIEGDISVVSEVDAANNLIRVKWPTTDDEVNSPWLLFISPLFYYLPLVGQQVVCFYDRYRRQGVAFGVQYLDGEAPFQDADKVGIDLGVMQLVISRATGKIEITTDETVTIKAKSVKIDCDSLEVTKELKVGGAATFEAAITAKSTLDATGKITSSVDVAAGATSLKLHTHLSAAPGSPTTPPSV